MELHASTLEEHFRRIESNKEKARQKAAKKSADDDAVAIAAAEAASSIDVVTTATAADVAIAAATLARRVYFRAAADVHCAESRQTIEQWLIGNKINPDSVKTWVQVFNDLGAADFTFFADIEMENIVDIEELATRKELEEQDFLIVKTALEKMILRRVQD